MSGFRKIIHKPGEVGNYETVFEENPYLRTGVPERKGTVERLDYTTDVYEDGKTYKKTAYVYLPYCYDPEDKERKYNVLYFQHGNTCEPAMFAVGGNKPMFDMLFESGENDPCIIVFITYYFDPMRDADARVHGGHAPAGDGWWPGIPGNYYKEIVKDIIPAVEMKYNTYLTDPSREGIKATRDHRAFAGYSRGTVTTWRMFNKDFEYFRYFCPTSGSIWGHHTMHEPHPEEDVCAYLREPIDAHPDLPFFLFVSNGSREMPELNEQMKYVTRMDCFSYGTDPKVNNIYYSRSDYYHTDYLIPYYFWNSLKVLFKG